MSGRITFPPAGETVDVNDEKTFTVTWRDENGVARDSVTTALMRDPDGNDVTLPAVAHGDTGEYSITPPKFPRSGIWSGRFETDDVITDAVDFEVRVNKSPFYP